MTEEGTLRRARDIAIYAALLGELPVGEKVICPIPGLQGNSPSFRLFEAEEANQYGYHSILWHCHRNGLTGDALQLLRLILGEGTPVDFREAITFFETHIATGEWAQVTDLPRSAPVVEPVVEWAESLREYEVEYYAEHNIPEHKLRRDGTRGVRKLQFYREGKPSRAWYSTPVEPMFGWTMGQTGGNKYYRPLSDPRYKWRGYRQPSAEVDGLELIPHGTEVTFVLSSRKDRQAVDHVLPCINPHAGESAAQVWENVLPEVLERTQYLCFLQDGDEAGVEDVRNICKKLNHPRVVGHDTRPYYAGFPHPDSSELILKDPAGVSLHYGLAAAEDLMSNIGRAVRHHLASKPPQG